jgi:hypothetical protein
MKSEHGRAKHHFAADVMSEKPKRPWFRFHLLTAVLVMLATASLLYLNLQVAQEGVEEASFGIRSSPSGKMGSEYWSKASIGWPCAFYEQRQLLAKAYVEHLDPSAVPAAEPTAIGDMLRAADDPSIDIRRVAYAKLWLDVCIAMASLTVVAILSESILRRRDARKT